MKTFIEIERNCSNSFVVAFAVTEDGPEAVAGDYFTALELSVALQSRYGWKIKFRPKGTVWYNLEGVDMLVAMTDDYELPAIRHAKPELIKVAWARNWFERWAKRPWLTDFHVLLASSNFATEYMRQNTNKFARTLRIATNLNKFNITQRPTKQSLDYVFTGNYWQAPRDIKVALMTLPRSLRGAIYGAHWEQVPEVSHLHRGFVPYSQIHGIYAQASIVIDDANHVTKDWGAANSRVFDALAAGCLVITNSESVSNEIFDGRLPVYRSPKELAILLDKYLADSEARASLVENLRSIVISRHSYAHRAVEFGLHLRLALSRELGDRTR